MHRTWKWQHDVEDIVTSALDLAFSFVPRVPAPHERPEIDPDVIHRLKHRFSEEIRPLYRDGYEAGVALAERLSWSQLSDLATHGRGRVDRMVWSTHRDDLDEVVDEVLSGLWGSGWRSQLKHEPIRARGLADALRDIWSAVWRAAPEEAAAPAPSAPSAASAAAPGGPFVEPTMELPVQDAPDGPDAPDAPDAPDQEGAR